MSNYKNLQFDCTVSDFRRWCNEFPPLEVGQSRKIYKDGDYFMSVEMMPGFLGSGSPFMGVTIREYDEEEQDFIYVSSEEQELLKATTFADKLRKYKSKKEEE